jgi:hypothetical protein
MLSNIPTMGKTSPVSTQLMILRPKHAARACTFTTKAPPSYPVVFCLGHLSRFYMFLSGDFISKPHRLQTI